MNKLTGCLVLLFLSYASFTFAGQFGIDVQQLVERKATGYGMYQKKTSNTYQKGQPIRAYAEPINFGYEKSGDGKYKFGFIITFRIKNSDGEAVSNEVYMDTIKMESWKENKEVYLDLTYNITGAPTGEYIISTTVEDIITSQKSIIDTLIRIL